MYFLHNFCRFSGYVYASVVDVCHMAENLRLTRSVLWLVRVLLSNFPGLFFK